MEKVEKIQTDIYLKIKDCLSSDRETQKKGENYLNNLKKIQLPELLTQLFLIMNDTTDINIDNNIKNLSSILFKNFLLEENNWINLPFLFKNKIREDLYNNIEQSNNENQIKYTCLIVANIAFSECQCNDVKMLKFIIKKIDNNIKDNNIKNIISYLFIMKSFFEEFEEQKLIAIDVINDLKRVLIPIIKSFKEKVDINDNNVNNKLEEKKLELALDNYSLILPFLKYSFTMEIDYIFNPIIDSLKLLNADNSVYLKNLMVINDTINYYHRYIVNQIKIICNLLFDIFDKFIQTRNQNKNINNIINDNNEFNKNKNIFLCYLDILSLICDKEVEDKTSLTYFFITNSNKYIPTLLSLLKIFPDYNLDNDSWNISKAICYIISFIINNSTDESILMKLLNNSSNNFNSISYDDKINSLLILSCCLESKNVDLIHNTLQPEIFNLINKINDKDQNYSYTVSWILGKISETVPSVFSQNNFNELISILINIINNKSDNDLIKYNNAIRINICIVFGNLIQFFGDDNSKNSITSFKSYYKLFINNFIESSCIEENIISGLSFYLLRIIMNAIQFSSNDLQDSLELIFSSLLDKFDKITNAINNNKSKMNNEQLNKVYKLQENLCLVINQIFNKIIIKININLCAKLYTSIIDSFLNRGAVPYDSGMLCLLNLVILLFNDESMKNMNNNKINVENFYKLIYAIFVNDDKDNENMKCIAILCLLNLLKINSSTLKDNIVEFYELLKTFSFNRTDLKQEFKDLIQKTIKEIEKNKIFLDKTISK